MAAHSTLPIILTPGEPAGIGMEITAKAWSTLRNRPDMCFAVIGDSGHVQKVCAQAGLEVQTAAVAQLSEARAIFETALPILERPLPSPVTPGTINPATAPWVMAAIAEAVDLCLTGEAGAIVTNPIHKHALYSAGFAFQGHTDYLAHLSRERGHDAAAVMMLVGGGLRAVPVTVHIALRDVAPALTGTAIETQARIVDEALKRYFGIASPRIAVTGLNPHAGENGAMGREEIEIIAPAIAQLRAEGLDIFGPLSADTAFFSETRGTYDAVLCMYHDQALIPVKTLDFHGGVNVTLGLPFIRTSPDHGTALALAGTGKAQAQSLIAAIELAAHMRDATPA